MACVPAARLDVENAALPDVTLTVASTVAPSVNCTVPVAAAATLAESVTLWPAIAGFGDGPPVNPVEIFITCESTPEVELKSPASPAYAAVIECVPCASDEV